MPARNCSVMACTSPALRSSSPAICWFDRFRPMKKAQDPDPQRLRMPGENGVGQVIKARLAGHAPVALPMSLPFVMAMPRHLVTLAVWATHAVRPSQMPHRVKALGIVNQELDVDQAVHRGRLLPADNGDHPRSQVQPSGISIILTDRRQDPRTNLLPTHHPETRYEPRSLPLAYRHDRSEYIQVDFHLSQAKNLPM